MTTTLIFLAISAYIATAGLIAVKTINATYNHLEKVVICIAAFFWPMIMAIGAWEWLREWAEN